MKAPGAQGQPGDMTEIDQSIVEETPPTTTPPPPSPSVICMLEKQCQDSTERAAAYIFSIPALPPVPSAVRLIEQTMP